MIRSQELYKKVLYWEIGLFWTKGNKAKFSEKLSAFQTPMWCVRRLSNSCRGSISSNILMSTGIRPQIDEKTLESWGSSLDHENWATGLKITVIDIEMSIFLFCSRLFREKSVTLINLLVFDDFKIASYKLYNRVPSISLELKKLQGGLKTFKTC